MFEFKLSFTGLPEIGFAHHFHTEKYNTWNSPCDGTFELVYIKQGGISVELFGKNFVAKPGSVLFLSRDLPWRLGAADGVGVQRHCSIQLKFSGFYFSRASEEKKVDGISLQLYYPPSEENERIKREMYSIISDLGVSREDNGTLASMQMLGLLGKLAAICNHKKKLCGSELISYRVKRFVQSDIAKKVTLEEIAGHVGKTPNYVNFCFREANGITIRQYINRERVRKISELIEFQWLSFEEACENVGIDDVTYGYRLFKKYMGVTPKAYLEGERYIKTAEWR